MATIFISHSSKDKEFARKLAADLTELGHTPWLDEYAIKVGDCIVSQMEEGLRTADFLVVVLSPNSVESGWVEREWKAKYWDEVNSKKTLVLPVLLADCEMPQFLKTKKYADFRRSHGFGLVHLSNAIDPLIRAEAATEQLDKNDLAPRIFSIITKVQSRSVPLSQCIAEALPLAQESKDPALEHFCRNELTGWDAKKGGERDANLNHREMAVIVSPFGEINAAYFGWGGDLSNALDYMRKDKEHYFPYTLVVTYPVSKLESDAPRYDPKGLMSIPLRQGDILKKCKDPDAHVVAYARSDSYANLVEGIRRELTQRLLALLPQGFLK